MKCYAICLVKQNKTVSYLTTEDMALLIEFSVLLYFIYHVNMTTADFYTSTCRIHSIKRKIIN